MTTEQKEGEGEEKHALFPALDDPEKCKVINEMLKKRDYADYQCYMLIRELFSRLGPDRVYSLLTAKSVSGLEEGEAMDLVMRMEHWRRVRNLSGEIMMQAMGNREPEADLYDELKQLEEDDEHVRIREEIRQYL